MNQWDDPESDQVVTSKDLYALLGVQRDATESQIKRAYHKLAKLHHPDKRASNPAGSDETMKEIGYAYKVLSDPEKRAIYDAGGTDALDEQEGMANLNLDQLLLNILMWEAGQKACFLCVLFLALVEAIILPLLVALRLDGVVDWSWFGITAPLWIPLGLMLPCLFFAPVAIFRQYEAGKNDPQVVMQSRATCMGCVAATIFLGCVASSGTMICVKLEGGGQWSFQQSMIPLYVLEGVLLVTYVGAPLKLVAEGVLWKLLRVGFLVLLAIRLDEQRIPWAAVLAPLMAGVLMGMGWLLYDVFQHRQLRLKTKSKVPPSELAACCL